MLFRFVMRGGGEGGAHAQERQAADPSTVTDVLIR